MKFLFFILVQWWAVLLGYSQNISNPIKIAEGSLEKLRNVKTVNVSFDYTGMMVGDETEAEYVERTKIRKNNQKPGLGDEWVNKWRFNREREFEPSFIGGLASGKGGIKYDKESSITLNLVITKIDPGFEFGFAFGSKDPQIHGVINVVETANPEVILCKLTLTKVKGRSDFDASSRLGNAFFSAGGWTNTTIYRALKE